MYIDECQNYITDTVAQLLSEARKFGLQAVLANQHLTQIDVGSGSANLLRAVIGNVGTILAMRVGAVDAAMLQSVFCEAIDAKVIQDLPDYHVAARLLHTGRPVRPFVFTTLATDVPSAPKSTRRSIRDAYVHRYTRSVAEIEQEIASRAVLNRY